MTPAWEIVRENGDASDVTERLVVPGGWLYRTWVQFEPHGVGTHAIAMVFVPMDTAESHKRTLERIRQTQQGAKHAD
jgi:hypothetical protein